MQVRRLSVAVVIVLTGACAGASTNPNISPTAQAREAIASQPSWFVNVPQDPNYIYAAKTETSRDMQLAINKAVQQGRIEIASQVEAKMEGRQKLFQAETGADTSSQIMKDFDEAQKQVVSQVINGSRVKHQVTTAESGIYRAFVLVEMPIGSANQAMMQKIKANQALYTRLRATKAFEELEKDVERFEAAKKSLP